MDKITQACEKHWDPHKDNCSGFVKAVATELGFTLTGQANDIVDQLSVLPWTTVTCGKQAKEQADLGYFVVGGLKATANGHVVVVVTGPLNREKYPTAYWGRLGGEGKKATTINWAWNSSDRDKVTYAYFNQLP